MFICCNGEVSSILPVVQFFTMTGFGQVFNDRKMLKKNTNIDKDAFYLSLTLPMLRLLSSIYHNYAKIFDNHLNPVMLVFIR